ncbi:6-phosphogluconolactonase [Candidatus Blochmannia ocreatus (nom. nud.)]|uniref:6-phosphogluconolactonase n=1 Tax=Candidatus Blochmannia ocreatus (nom. nud.) TaxID=251538 RepID=A0ABY4STU6_9ENTR|nr:6-phosphogluconolactonase [Candidatus Blochmannia ocreatus]URJ25401.1 6-phosphogluconolactonase [Candidatus Blochmannia ocreatus]
MMQIVYVASPDSCQIYVWKLDSINGFLQLVQVVNTPGQVYPMVVNSNKKFLYVGIRPDFGIITYTISSEGFLIINSSIKLSGSPTHLMSNINGTFLYCTSYKRGAVYVIPINKFGVLDCAVQIIPDLSGCHSANIDNHGVLLWVPCLQEHVIKLFKIDICGKLTPWTPGCIKSSVIGSGPRHMVFHKTGDYAYVINELLGTIDIIKYDDYCSIPNIIQTISLIPKNFISKQQFWSSDIHMTSNGRWLYCSDRVTNIISFFKIIQRTKKLKFVGYQITETQPRGFTIDDTGNFLIVAGQKSNYISVYRINLISGRLHFLSRHFSGLGPVWISTVTLLDG